ncbi:MAG: hypothetical protein JO264_04165 [Acidisphaera sp.]|nr:hypothetical protein [Acidisphaera sp.]
MRILERLLCTCMWLAWVGLSVDREGTRPGEWPKPLNGSGDASRCLLPNRTILPGWWGSL